MSGIDREVRLAQLTADADACGPEARSLFDRLIREGKTPEAAAMYACQQAPGTRNTDRAFCQGQRRKMEGMSPLVGGMLHRTAAKAGINTAGKYYMSGIGKATDPAAWVTCAEDLLTVAKARNLNIEGVINRKAVETAPVIKPSEKVAPDIVNRLARKAIEADPALREKVSNSPRARQELREKIIEKHGRKKFTKKTKLFG